MRHPQSWMLGYGSKNDMDTIRILPFTFLILFAGHAHAAKSIENLIDIQIPVYVDGTYPSLDVVRAAIISGCSKRGWTPVLDGENKIVASILVRSKHYAEIEIPYSDREYSILYKASKNLNYNAEKRKIHRNYNKWVVMLSSSIQRELGIRSQGY